MAETVRHTRESLKLQYRRLEVELDRALKARPIEEIRDEIEAVEFLLGGEYAFRD